MTFSWVFIMNEIYEQYKFYIDQSKRLFQLYEQYSYRVFLNYTMLQQNSFRKQKFQQCVRFMLFSLCNPMFTSQFVQLPKQFEKYLRGHSSTLTSGIACFNELTFHGSPRSFSANKAQKVMRRKMHVIKSIFLEKQKIKRFNQNQRCNHSFKL